MSDTSHYVQLSFSKLSLSNTGCKEPWKSWTVGKFDDIIRFAMGCVMLYIWLQLSMLICLCLTLNRKSYTITHFVLLTLFHERNILNVTMIYSMTFLAVLGLRSTGYRVSSGVISSSSLTLFGSSVICDKSFSVFGCWSCGSWTNHSN